MQKFYRDYDNHSGFDLPREPDGTGYSSFDFSNLNAGARIKMSSSRPHSFPFILQKYSGWVKMSGRDRVIAACVFITRLSMSS